MKFEETFSINEMEILKSICVEISGERYPLVNWVRVTDESRIISIDAKGKPEFAEDKFTKEEKDFLSNVYVICYYRIYPISTDTTGNVKVIHLQKGEVFTLKDFKPNYDKDMCYKKGFVEREFIPKELLELFDEEVERRKHEN